MFALSAGTSCGASAAGACSGTGIGSCIPSDSGETVDGSAEVSLAVGGCSAFDGLDVSMGGMFRLCEWGERRALSLGAEKVLSVAVQAGVNPFVAAQR